MDDEGKVHTGHKNVAAVAVNYFQSLLDAAKDIEDFPDFNFSNILSEEDVSSLIEPFNSEDILATFKSMAKGKSPGLDGFTPEFFLHAWKIVGTDTCNAILDFFQTDYLPRIINSSAMVLIPKQPNASHMNHFRPISCCNTIYKCIAKLLASRMRRVMTFIISLNQTAFVPSRHLGTMFFLPSPSAVIIILILV